MLIDWFTVGAQALNFLVLVYLLRRFLYRPVQDAIDARERRIAEALADATAKQSAAQAERDALLQRIQTFDQERADRWAEATEATNIEQRRLVDAARVAAVAASTAQGEKLRQEAAALSEALVRRTRQEVFAITRQALADLADAGLEERIGEVFVRRLGSISGEEKQSFATALRTASEPAVVRSTFVLPEPLRAAIRTALDDVCAAESSNAAARPLRFELSPELIGGMELAVNGQKLSWSLADYVSTLEQGVGELLGAAVQPAPTPVPAAVRTPVPASEAAPAAAPSAAPAPEPARPAAPNPEPKPAPELEASAASR